MSRTPSPFISKTLVFYSICQKVQQDPCDSTPPLAAARHPRMSLVAQEKPAVVTWVGQPEVSKEGTQSGTLAAVPPREGRPPGQQRRARWLWPAALGGRFPCSKEQECRRPSEATQQGDGDAPAAHTSHLSFRSKCVCPAAS